ncbi:hypothetical protein XH97_01345 [Bradyrhizobium sp. CCBAU 53380]|nr:hypothetical protein [Bradyrhizobium sp. CCBAU 53380]
MSRLLRIRLYDFTLERRGIGDHWIVVGGWTETMVLIASSAWWGISFSAPSMDILRVARA